MAERKTSSSQKYELKKKNPISLREDELLDDFLKPLTIGGKNTNLELSNDTLRINGKFEVHSGDVNFHDNNLYIAGRLNFEETNPIISAKSNILFEDGYTGDTPMSIRTSSNLIRFDDGFKLMWGEDGDDDGTIEAANINFNVDAVPYLKAQGLGGSAFLTFYGADGSGGNTGSFYIACSANGAITMQSTDIDGAAANMNLIPDGDLVLDPVSQKTIINATDGLYFDGGTHTYIDEESDDLFRFTVGADDMLLLDEASDKITMAATNWVAGTVSGATITEFSAANSAYAGMILGYTRLEGDLTNIGNFEIQNSITVEDDTHKVTFKTPPSELVELELTVDVDIVSTDTRVTIGLSTANATDGYASVAVQFEYDVTGITFSDDEVNDNVKVVKWVLSASQLEAIGSDNTFWVGFGTAGVAKFAYIKYGVRASHGVCHHPFVFKATALPATIYDGQ